MRDRLLNFGIISLTTDDTAVTSPNVLEGLSEHQTVGQKGSINIIVSPQRKLANTELVTLTFEESDSDSSGFTEIASYTSKAVAHSAGDKIKFRYPRDVKQYTRVTAKIATLGSACDLDVYIEMG